MHKAWRPLGAALSSLVAGALLASCGSLGGGRVKLEPEAFGSTTTHSRRFDSAPAYTCEAARRALLSQGFVITAADGERVNGRKYFQPEPEVHVQLEFHTVCAPDGRGGRATLAFVNALQDRYALKKSNNSASVGVGAIGSLSLPFTSSDDSLVKVASETITSAPFYDRFYKLLQRYLVADAELVEPKAEPMVIAPVPPAAAASAAMPAASAASAP
ncbi:DUF2242 domain-containing protein [Rhizobacter sp. Root404]|uniref:DUF2242 domain-containing protein n=1 Tax=Rhizobacter sp. Root404 TaxID=1736528 RepID=UPI0006F31499|nr:DUF2242 domain-containing protein [Rhizobacter sp. Root404]KQW37560.1 hypothetical protein ASC76_05445 [Rhizobacter sp. Root404]